MDLFLERFVIFYLNLISQLIHKNRPKLINYDKLVSCKDSNKIENLKEVQDAAEKYFGLEKYLTAGTPSFQLIPNIL